MIDSCIMLLFLSWFGLFNNEMQCIFYGEVVFAGTLLVLLSRPMIQRAVGQPNYHGNWPIF